MNSLSGPTAKLVQHLAKSTVQAERDQAALLSTATIFVIGKPESRTDQDVLDHLFSYGADLSKFGLMRLPVERCCFQLPFSDEGERYHNIITCRDRPGGINIRFNSILEADGSVAPSCGTLFLPRGADISQLQANRRLHQVTLDAPLGTKLSDGTTFDAHARSGLSLGVGLLAMTLGLLSTRGVVISPVDGAPKNVNVRRARDGKLPLLAYRHIILNLEELRSSVRGAGHHAPPRLHLRRGHVRRLAPDRLVNVRPCVVGDPARGTVLKDYVVAPGGIR